MTAKKKKAMTEEQEVEAFILEGGSESLAVFGGKFEGGIQCQHIADELAPCIAAILETGHPVTSFLEIGAVAGGTVVVFDQFFMLNSIVVVDDNRHPKSHLRSYILRDIKHQEIITPTFYPGSKDALDEIGAEFDIILIDGAHDQETVNAEIKGFTPFLAPGGFLILHDTASEWWGVGKAVAAHKKGKTFDFIGEYISPTHPNPCGTALFRKA